MTKYKKSAKVADNGYLEPYLEIYRSWYSKNLDSIDPIYYIGGFFIDSHFVVKKPYRVSFDNFSYKVHGRALGYSADEYRWNDKKLGRLEEREDLSKWKIRDVLTQQEKGRPQGEPYEFKWPWQKKKGAKNAKNKIYHCKISGYLYYVDSELEKLRKIQVVPVPELKIGEVTKTE